MSKFSRARNTNKGKNSTSVTPVIGIANSEGILIKKIYIVQIIVNYIFIYIYKFVTFR